MRFSTLSLVLILGIGCGRGLPVAPASGIVTLNGKPLAGATINTQPVAKDSRNPGPGSFGHTDDQGRFELEVVQPAMKGAIIGKHRVMISPPGDGSRDAKPKRSADGTFESWSDDPQSHRAAAGAKWPVRFADGSLTMEVPADGTNELRLELKR